MIEFVARHTVSDNEFFLFAVDEYKMGEQQLLLSHLDFRKFSPTALKRAHSEWVDFRRCVPAPLYAYQGPGDEKLWRHYISRFGFVPTDIHLPLNNGIIRQLFISKVTDARYVKQHTERLNVFTDEPVGTAGGCANQRVQ